MQLAATGSPTRRGRRILWVGLAISLSAAVIAISAARSSAPPDTETVAGQAGLSDNVVGRLFDLPLPGVSNRAATPKATGNKAADKQIRDIALERGYQLRGEPIDPMSSYQGRLLQQRALDDLVRLQTSMAAEAGVTLTLTSAHRSAARQRQLFLAQLSTSSLALRSRVVTNNEIALGLADDVLHNAMSRAAPPGFSRHHTGLVIDVSSGGVGSFGFATTAAYVWLTANNYANAMAHGWIPSYPPNASAQGPAPEPWEWAWIGRGSAACAIEAGCGIGAVDHIDDDRTVGWGVSPDGQRPRAVRLVTEDHIDPLNVEWTRRIDVAAAYGLGDGEFGFTSTRGVAPGTQWACVEARTRSGGPWHRIGCADLR